MGFSDAGAHLRNMAFYNFALQMLKRTGMPTGPVRRFCPPKRAVHRLTGELASGSASTPAPCARATARTSW